MKTILTAILLLGFSSAALAERKVSEHNLSGTLALKGYDPVSYFPEGGGSPLEGSDAFMYNYEGATYFFANQANQNIFRADPEKYEPTYGGWCAWAMANGSKIDIKPELFTLDGNRLHLFVAKRAKRRFDADVAKYSARADENWFSFSGEEPRR